MSLSSNEINQLEAIIKFIACHPVSEGHIAFLRKFIDDRKKVQSSNQTLINDVDEEAKAFEKTVDASVNITRHSSTLYAWGWGYESSETQSLFRQFCVQQHQRKHAEQ